MHLTYDWIAAAAAPSRNEVSAKPAGRRQLRVQQAVSSFINKIPETPAC
jgi:hypothetical protein